jgi:hypothetical protein
MKARVLLLLSILLVSTLVGAQEPVQVPRRLMLLVEPLRGSTFTTSELLLLYESLLIKLETEAPEVAVFESREPKKIPKADEEKSEKAREIGADAWLWVGLEGGMESLTLKLKSYDLIAEKTVIDTAVEKAGVRGIERRFWDEVIRAVKESYEAKPQRVVESEVTETNSEVTLIAVPGTEIVGLTDDSLFVGENGEVTVGLNQSATYTFRATKRGYYPLMQTFALTTPEMNVVLEQRKASQFAVEFYLNNLTYPGLEFCVYIIPNLLFGRLGFNTFLIGFPFRNLVEGGRTSFGLTHLNIATGVYLNGPDSLFRFYVCAGMFLRIIHLEDESIMLDPISAVGIFPGFGVEVSTIPTFRFFIEYRPLVYFTSEPELLAASYAKSKTEEGSGKTEDVNLTPPFIFPDIGGMIDPTNFNLGLRIQL